MGIVCGFVLCIVFWVLSAVLSTYIGGRGSLGEMLFFSIPTEHLRNRVFTMILITVMGLVASLVYKTYYSRDRRRIKEAMHVIEQRQGEVTSLLESTHNVLEEREFGKVARSLFDSCKNLIGATTGYLALLSENEQDEDVIFIDSGKFMCTVSSGQPFRVG